MIINNICNISTLDNINFWDATNINTDISFKNNYIMNNNVKLKEYVNNNNHSFKKRLKLKSNKYKRLQYNIEKNKEIKNNRDDR